MKLPPIYLVKDKLSAPLLQSLVVYGDFYSRLAAMYMIPRKTVKNVFFHIAYSHKVHHKDHMMDALLTVSPILGHPN